MVSDYSSVPGASDYDSLLKKHGFERLSSEGCGLSMRTLYDIDPQAIDILERFLSVNFGQAENSWNHDRLGQGWKSFMMPHSMRKDLCIFILAYWYHYSYIGVANVTERSHLGFTANYIEGFGDVNIANQWAWAAHRIYGKDSYHIVYANGDSLNGTRNRHYWSGRVE
jgi:hypothetical protein